MQKSNRIVQNVTTLNKLQRKPKGQSRKGQSRETGNIGYTRRRQTQQKTKKMSNTDPTKNQE